MCSVLRIDRDHRDASFLRFAPQDLKEPAPASVVCGLREPTSGDTFDVEDFVGYQSAPVNQFAGFLKLRGLVHVRDRTSLRLVKTAALFESRVVKAAVDFERRLEGFRLGTVGIEAVLEGLPHAEIVREKDVILNMRNLRKE